MKTKYLFLAALSAIALTSCTSEDFLDTSQTIAEEGDLKPILFNSLGQGMTRADFVGKDAAEKLDKKFVVFGYKGSKTGTPGQATDGIAGGTVFDNYFVEYTANTAGTTASNTNNWEYAGKGLIHWAKEHHISSQTIKYWDYSQSQYDFFAWSTGLTSAVYTGSYSDGKVLVSAMNATAATESDDPKTGLKNAYTFAGKAADLKDCYISDLVTVYKGTSTGTGTKYGVVDKGYQQPVLLKFRQLGTKVRIGIYETIPGYSVKDVKFYRAADVALPTGTGEDVKSYLFTTTANDIFTEGTYTVYFPTTDNPTNPDNNQAHIKFSGTGAQSTTVGFGTLNYTIREQGESSEDAIYLGRTSNTASMAGEPSENYYDFFLPNQAGTNLNLRVNYTLESIDGSKELIEVKGATAQVPSIYTQWKPGYAYTYLFKISDKTNGYTGVYDPTKPDDTGVNSDPAGLYPITFDALVVNAEDGDQTQETITTVSTPSITTYQQGSNVVNANEYSVIPAVDGVKTGEIYVTVNDGNSSAANQTPDLANGKLQDLSPSGKAKLYVLTDGKTFTEAEVIDALALQQDDKATGVTVQGRNGLKLTEAAGSNALSLTNEVKYGVDVNTITIPATGDAKYAAKFYPAASTIYAFVYEKAAASGAEASVAKYEAIDFSTFTGTKYRYDLKAADAGDCQKGVAYFSVTGGDYASHTAFIGQEVSNLYVKDGSKYVPASGYAKTGTTYYYTLDNGQSYIDAHNVAYADISSVTIYTKSGDDYPEVTDKTDVPVNNTAYYYLDGSDYKYCVFLPERTNDLKVVDDTKYVPASESTAVTGMTYFDKFTKNNAVRYAKVIKVQ